MTAVSNSSPLIALAQIEQLELLHQLFGSILIPQSVRGEIRPTVPVIPDWIEVKPPTQNMPMDLARPGLSQGERDVLALAIESRPYRVIIDELIARRVAAALRLPLTGTLGVLMSAKRKGLIESVRVQMDRLIDSGFFIGQALYREILFSVSELA